MKTILYVFVCLFIGANFTSCTPQDAIENPQSINETDMPECCGDGGDIPPPPPGGE